MVRRMMRQDYDINEPGGEYIVCSTSGFFNAAGGDG